MPNQPPTQLRCKKCEGSQFKTISELRQHQWAQHREAFANLVKSAKNGSLARKYHCSKCPRKFKTMAEFQRHAWDHRKDQALTVRQAQALLPPTPTVHLENGNGDMRVSELLVELQKQQNFLNDVVGMIGGILSRRREGQ